MTDIVKKNWTEDEVEILIEGFKNGTSSAEIAESLNHSLRSVSSKAACLNLKNKKRIGSFYTASEDDYIKKYAQSMVRADIAEVLGRTEGSISQRGRKLGISFKNFAKISKYQKNHSFFHEPTLENSYIAGLLAADGWVRVESGGKTINQVGIALKRSDAHLLEYIRMTTGYSGNIRDFSVNEHPQSELRISGVPQWLHDLESNWNLVPRKSYILDGPSDKNLSEDQLLAYLVGLIEGDGHICIKNKTLKVEIVTASPAFADWLEKTLERLVGEQPSRYLHAHGRAHYIGFYGSNARTLCERLMSVGVHRLIRKWSVAEDQLNWFS